MDIEKTELFSTYFIKNMNKKLLVMRLQYILFDIYDLFSFFVFVFGLVLLVRFFVFNPFTVVGASMQPNFTE